MYTFSRRSDQPLTSPSTMTACAWRAGRRARFRLMPPARSRTCWYPPSSRSTTRMRYDRVGKSMHALHSIQLRVYPNSFFTFSPFPIYLCITAVPQRRGQGQRRRARACRQGPRRPVCPSHSLISSGFRGLMVLLSYLWHLRPNSPYGALNYVL